MPFLQSIQSSLACHCRPNLSSFLLRYAYISLYTDFFYAMRVGSNFRVYRATACFQLVFSALFSALNFAAYIVCFGIRCMLIFFPPTQMPPLVYSNLFI
jgi:hypothetical protein